MFAALITDCQSLFRIMGSPTRFYQELPKDADLKEPLRFAGLMLALQIVVSYLSRIFIYAPFNNRYLPIFFALEIISILIFPFFISVFSNLLQGRGSYKESLRFICYASAMNAFVVVTEPFGAWMQKAHASGASNHLVGFMMLIVNIMILIKCFNIYLAGMREIHGLRTLKALLVLLVPGILFISSMLWLVSLLGIKGAHG